MGNKSNFFLEITLKIKNMKKKTAIVIGGSKGIGAGIAKSLKSLT